MMLSTLLLPRGGVMKPQVGWHDSSSSSR